MKELDERYKKGEEEKFVSYSCALTSVPLFSPLYSLPLPHNNTVSSFNTVFEDSDNFSACQFILMFL